MRRQSARKTVGGGNQQRGGQEASSRTDPISIYITNDKMETMMNVMQERMIARQDKMMESFFRRMGQTGTARVAAN